MSTGSVRPPWLAGSSESVRGAGRERRDRRGPPASHASAARMPGPPALVRIATRRPARQRLARQQGADLEHLLEGRRANDAGLEQQRIDQRVSRRQRAGVRRGGPRARCRSSGLDRHDGFASRHPSRHLQEPPRLGNRLEIEQDHARPLVGVPQLQQVAGGHVGTVSNRGEVRDAEIQLAGGLQHRQVPARRFGWRTPPGLPAETPRRSWRSAGPRGRY